MSAQKGQSRVYLYILRPLMCSGKGNHLEGAGVGVGGPNLELSAACPDSVVVSAALPLHGASPQARAFSPAFHVITPGHLLQDTCLNLTLDVTLDVTHPLFLSTFCSFSSWCQVSLVACSLLCILLVNVLDVGDITMGKGANITHLAYTTFLGIRDKLNPQCDNFPCTSCMVSLPLVDPPQRKCLMEADMDCSGIMDLC